MKRNKRGREKKEKTQYFGGQRSRSCFGRSKYTLLKVSGLMPDDVIVMLIEASAYRMLPRS